MLILRSFRRSLLKRRRPLIKDRIIKDRNPLRGNHGAEGPGLLPRLTTATPSVAPIRPAIIARAADLPRPNNPSKPTRSFIASGTRSALGGKQKLGMPPVLGSVFWPKP